MTNSPFIFFSLTFFGIFIGQFQVSPIATVSEPKVATECLTPACKYAAAYLLEAMNTSVSPCANFYEYACGGWRTHHRIPDSQDRTGTFSVATDKLNSDLVDALGQFNIATESKTSSGAVAYVAYIHQQCTSLGKVSTEIGQAHLKSLTQSILAGQEWPIGQHSDSKKSHSWKDNYVRALAAGVSSVFDLTLMPDFTNSSRNNLAVSEAK